MNKNKKIILILCSLFIVLSGVLYLNSDFIGRYSIGKNSTGEYVSETNTGTDGFISSVQDGDDTAKNSKLQTSSEDIKADSENSRIVVYICGAVKKPGVYEFGADSRVCDAVKAAKGFKKGAARTSINQARLLVDGEQINILTFKQYKKKSSNKATQQTEAETETNKDGLVNINTASAAELTSLSGIGQSRADAIIEYRETSGTFKDISDIMKISGIKEGIFNKIKNNICV